VNDVSLEKGLPFTVDPPRQKIRLVSANFVAENSSGVKNFNRLFAVTK
jgi:hypothetical protein